MKMPNISEFLGLNIYKKDSEPVEKVFDQASLGPKEVYFEWEAETKTGKKFNNKKLGRTFVVIGIVVGLLLAVMQEFVLILLIGSLVFITQVFSKYPLQKIKYEISNHGISVNGKYYFWNELKQYFFIDSDDFTNVLALDTKQGMPGRIFINFNKTDKEKIKEIIGRYLFFLEEEPKTFFDKTYASVLDKLNI